MSDRCSVIKLFMVFGIALSLASLPGPLSGLFHLPSIPAVFAAQALVEPWYPAGPAMDTLSISIFQDGITELSSLDRSPPPLDFTDQPLSKAQIQQFCSSPAFFCTSPVPEHGYDELEYNMANNYWGVGMNFGNDQNGVQLRQGIAHLINKANFITNEPSIAGLAAPIDNPIPSNSSFNGVVLPTPNPCGWDTLFPQSGSQCTNGAPGGIAYNCAVGARCPTGALGPVPPNTWQAQIGSSDFCAAATHFMNALNNGVLTSSKGVHLNANCELLAPGSATVGVGWPANVTSNEPNLFARLDDASRLSFGNSYAQEICALWTGNYSTGCDPFLNTRRGTITGFCGFFTSTTGISECWWMYTAKFTPVFPFDSSLYFGYNSQFVSGGTWDHPACKSNTPTPSANNYEYICNSAYDTASASAEFPSDGTIATSFANAQTALNLFGQGAYTIPIFTPQDEFVYLSNWHRAINGDGVGTPNFFTWLNAWTPTPSSTCPSVFPSFTNRCIRQGFSQPTRALSPFIASTSQDFRILGDIYDSLGIENPASNGQLMDWMTIRAQELTMQADLGYTPPLGTTDNFRFTLRTDLFWHDGTRVTSWDVQMSFASLLANGAFAGSGLAPLLPPSGSCNNSPPASNGNCSDQITVLSPTQFDVHVYQHGPFTLLGLMTTLVFPGRYWSAAGSNAWLNCVAQGSCPASAISADPNKLGFTYDPINTGTFIGSGAWECIGSSFLPGPGLELGSGCSSTGLQNPPPGGSYFLTRNGQGFAPGQSPQNTYFRSSGNLALYLWSGNTGDPVGDPLNFSRFASCFGRPVGLTGCTHWQEGIGNAGASAGSGNLIGGIQAGIIARFVFLNWVLPFDAHRNPPVGIASFDPVLYEGPLTLNPASMVGCALPANGLPTVPGYPNGGGYDC